MVRKHNLNTAEADNQSNRYDTIDKYMVARDPIMVAGTVGTTSDLEAN